MWKEWSGGGGDEECECLCAPFFFCIFFFSQGVLFFKSLSTHTYTHVHTHTYTHTHTHTHTHTLSLSLSLSLPLSLSFVPPLGVTVALIVFGLDLMISSMHDVREMIASGWSPLLFFAVVVRLLAAGCAFACKLTLSLHATLPLSTCESWVHLYPAASVHAITMYVAWVFFACGMLFLAAFLTHHISPHAIGSGIPQMKVWKHVRGRERGEGKEGKDKREGAV